MEESFEGATDRPGGMSKPRSVPPQTALLAHRQISLAETLHRVLNKGVVLTGEVTVSVADIDLLYLGLNLIITSVETMERHRRGEGTNGHS
jgi:hypothetical protein